MFGDGEEEHSRQKEPFKQIWGTEGHAQEIASSF